ncbi:MAG: hypothetical protein ACREHC_07845 [Candidatus Levyibacteriota bacterium]
MHSNKIWYKLGISFFFLVVFFFTSNSITDPDMWFHIKSGEVIANQGIIFHDVFSSAAPNRPWYPHEWLFQLGLFRFTSIFGIDAVKYFVGFFATFQIAILFIFLRKTLKLKIIASMFVCIMYTLLCYNLFVPRPQLVSQTLFIANTFLLLAYIFNDKYKKLLFLSIPVTLLWTNIHASVILNVFLFAGYIPFFNEIATQ